MDEKENDKQFVPDTSDEIENYQAFYQFGLAAASREVAYHNNLELIERAKELEEANARLHKRNQIDSKTGLLNAEGLEHEYSKLAEAFSKHRRRADEDIEPANHSMLFCDLDKFGDINKTIGHPTADKLLLVVSQFMAGNLREGDIAGRFGGDEFVVVLPNTGQEEAKVVAERIRESVSSITEFEGTHLNPTVSIGVGSFDPALSLGDALKQANQAMYSAKGGGRNQVVIFEAAA